MTTLSLTILYAIGATMVAGPTVFPVMIGS